jgi:hypothetical protein
MTGKSQDGNFDKTPPVGIEEYDTAIRSFCGAYEEIFKLSYCCLKATLPKRARVLVVGAGTGMEIVEFAPLTLTGHFVVLIHQRTCSLYHRKKYQRRRFRTKFV